MAPKQIRKPQLKSAQTLSALDMNNIHFDKRHTVLTPELLENLGKQTPESADSATLRG